MDSRVQVPPLFLTFVGPGSFQKGEGPDHIKSVSLRKPWKVRGYKGEGRTTLPHPLLRIRTTVQLTKGKVQVSKRAHSRLAEERIPG